MTQHRHVEMIKAKADNMELVKFKKPSHSKEWMVDNNINFLFHGGCEYFLCLPQHKEACLHWLNGGEVTVNDEPYWNDAPQTWCWQNDFMNHGLNIRIKPKKEKRWIAITRRGCVDKLFDNKSQAEEFVTGCLDKNHVSDFQFIEIEIEV